MFRKSGYLLITLLALIVMTTGCASKRQADRILIQVDSIAQRTEIIEQKIIRLDSLTQAQEESQRQFLARMESSITEFEDRLEELGFKITDLNDRIGLLQRSGAGVAQLPVQEESDTVEDTTANAQTAIDPNVIYNSAFNNLQAGNHQIAILGFSEYITSFPKTDLADDAQFWLGECYYQQNPPKYEQAAEEFSKVVDNYPESNRMAGARFKLARCHEELGQREKAIDLYRKIMTEFPNTAEANRAKVQLSGLGEKTEEL
jgi:tol-pal system protein YbgF